jgi:hypothetical protein
MNYLIQAFTAVFKTMRQEESMPINAIAGLFRNHKMTMAM